MKAVFVCALLAVVVVLVYGERCHSTQECIASSTTTCSNGAKEYCDHGQCHCTAPHQTNSTCNTKSDCPDCSNHRSEHCIDNRCHCGIRGN